MSQLAVISLAWVVSPSKGCDRLDSEINLVTFCPVIGIKQPVRLVFRRVVILHPDTLSSGTG